jgi:hypothetical protein
MQRDDPAIAEAIVVHAETLCEREPHLWDVIGQLSIPVGDLTDTRNQNKVTFETESLVRAFLYQRVKGLSQNELADRLNSRPSLVKTCGFDIRKLDNAPKQGTINHAWRQFSEGTQEIIKAAAKGIAQVAVENDVIAESLVATDPSKEDEDEQTEGEAHRQKTTKTIKLARHHAFPEFESGRAINRTYEDEEILEMFARACAYRGSANSEGEYGWLTNDDQTAHGSTILRVIKQFATPSDEDAQLTIDDLLQNDNMPEVDAIRDELMESFDGAVDNIISSIQGAGPFNDRKKTAAIDITHEEVSISPWENKDEGITRPDFPRMVSGYKKDNDYKRGYKYATITLAGDLAPIILGVEPVKENSKWEDDDAPSYSKADIVERLLAKAERYVDLDEVYLDRGFHSKGVYAAIENRDIIYTAPVPKYQDDLDTIKDIKEHPDADAAVKHNVPVGYNGEVHHTAEYLYVPSTSDDADGKYAVFTTNRDDVGTEEIAPICNNYSRRWEIENQYKSIEEFLPKTSSMDYRVRFTNFVLAALLYNLWRLTDYLIKIAREQPIRSPPVVGVKTFVRAIGEFLREID